MTDPHYQEKVEAVADLGAQVQAREHAALRRPRMLGLGLLVGPIISAEGGGGVGTAVTYGGLLGGGVAYGAGYFAFGGRDCNEARAIYNKHQLRRGAGLEHRRGRGRRDRDADARQPVQPDPRRCRRFE